MPCVDSLCDWLAAHGAADQAHSGRVLLTHLRGTWALLQAAGLDEAVCVGGLFHSVYGTNVFKPVTVAHDQRAAVQALIGERAERLAWLFGHLQRPQVLVAALHAQGLASLVEDVNARLHLRIDAAVVADLQAIECANLLEQGVLWKQPALVKVAQQLGVLGLGGFESAVQMPYKPPTNFL
jgi:hypothetical protein